MKVRFPHSDRTRFGDRVRGPSPIRGLGEDRRQRIGEELVVMRLPAPLFVAKPTPPASCLLTYSLPKQKPRF